MRDEVPLTGLMMDSSVVRLGQRAARQEGDGVDRDGSGRGDGVEVEVRRHLCKHMVFGAVAELLPAFTDTEHASSRYTPSLKEGRKPRFIVSQPQRRRTCAAATDNRAVDDAVEASHPGCWYDQLNVSRRYCPLYAHFTLAPADCVTSATSTTASDIGSSHADMLCRSVHCIRVCCVVSE